MKNRPPFFFKIIPPLPGMEGIIIATPDESPKNTFEFLREENNCIQANYEDYDEIDESNEVINSFFANEKLSRNWTNIYKKHSSNQEEESSDNRANIIKLRNLVAKKEYPISVIEIDKNEESAKSAIEYIVQLIQFSSSSNQWFSIQHIKI